MEGDDSSGLTEIAAAPAGLRAARVSRSLSTAGVGSWLVIGIAGVGTLLLLLLALTAEIAVPLAIAAVLATVLVPLTDRLERARVPRGLAAVLVLLLGVVVVVAIVVMIVSGIVAQSDEIWLQLERGLHELNERLSGGGHSAELMVEGAHDTVRTLTSGVLGSFVASTGAFVISSILALFMLLFLLKDWEPIVDFTTRHAVVPVERARHIVDGLVTAFRGYAWGLTVLGVANAAVVALGAWLLGVPLVGPIAVVSFVTSYVPYLGAFVAGAFAVLIAYGSGGMGDALAMLLVVLLANGLIQNLLEPFALGARLRLHPLAVLLIVTSAAALVGALGAVLAAPLVSAAVNVRAQLASNDDVDDGAGRPDPRV
jgi:predicted PurR-regulated permease PerM